MCVMMCVGNSDLYDECGVVMSAVTLCDVTSIQDVVMKILYLLL